MGKKSANAEKKLPPLKPILALPTWGQMWILSELWVLEKGNFDLGHPVVLTHPMLPFSCLITPLQEYLEKNL